MKRVTRKLLLAAAVTGALGTAATANLLYNTSFEIESAFSYGFALNWKMNDPDDHGDAWGSAARESWRAREGQFLMALRGGWANTGDNGGVWQEAEGHAGHTYRLTAWFWADPEWTCQHQEIKIEFWNWDRTSLLGSASNPLGDIKSEWVQREVSAVAPEGTEWVRAVILMSGAGPAGSLQVDDVELTGLP